MASDDGKAVLQQARAEYTKATDELTYTKDFQTRQEALMHDPMATVGERVMAWILRHSWGHQALYAIHLDGEPALQRDCAEELGIDKRRVSAAVSYFQKRRYLEKDGKLLRPFIKPVLEPPPQEDEKSTEYRTFLEEWKVQHSSDFEEEKVLRSQVKEKVKVRLGLYKKWLASRTNGAGILIEEDKEDIRGKSSSSAVSSAPSKPVEKAEEEDAYQRFKKNYPANHFDEAKAQDAFEKKTQPEKVRILERLEVYKASDRWKDAEGQWIPLASTWLKSYDKDPPPKLKPKARANGKPDYAEELHEAAQRRITKYGSVY